jgi:beta-glucosidase
MRRAVRTLPLTAALVGSLILLAASCRSSTAGDGGTDAGPTCDPAVAAAHLCGEPGVDSALALLHSMTLEEKVQQMSGPGFNPNDMYDQPDNVRLAIPGHRYLDGTRGARWYNSDYGTTAFPVAAVRAASWDPELERLIGRSIARELRALGRSVLVAPNLTVVTHPRWGRSQEAYGEDTFLVGVMGASFIAGVQHDPRVADPADPSSAAEDTYRVQACAGHFVANDREDDRIYVNAVLDPRTLREIYLPAFKKAVDAGAACTVTALNRVNGDYTHQSRPLLRDLLKGDWGFRGYVVSDWFATKQAQQGTASVARAGLDVEMPFSSCPGFCDPSPVFVYGSLLTAAVNAGEVDVALVDEAVLRILHQKVAFGLLDHPARFAPAETRSAPAQALALRAAREGMVLLKNGQTAALADDVLPLHRAAVNKLAVVGRFADAENLGDKGSSDAKVIDRSLVVTPFEGLRDALTGAGKSVVTFQQIAGNEASVGGADVVVVVAAYAYADLARSSSGEEGEWKDRASLALPQRDLDNVNAALALKKTNPALRVVVVVKSGGAVLVQPWLDGVDALLQSGFGGMKEGTALAEILFGDVNPSGRLVQSTPLREEDLPAFDDATHEDAQIRYYQGYRYFDKAGITPRYWFGEGLGYTTFAFSNLRVPAGPLDAESKFTVTVDVTNTGPVAGTEVVQLYVGYAGTSLPAGTPLGASQQWGRPARELKAFSRAVDLAPGATTTVALQVDTADLGYWDESRHAFVVEKMQYQLTVAGSANPADPNLLTASFTLR